MKLVRYGQMGREKPGLIDADGKLRDLSQVIADVTPEHLSDKALAKLARIFAAGQGQAAHGLSHQPCRQIHRHWLELCRPCGRIQYAYSQRAHRVHEGQ